MLNGRKFIWISSLLVLSIFLAGCSPGVSETSQAPAVTTAPQVSTALPPTQTAVSPENTAAPVASPAVTESQPVSPAVTEAQPETQALDGAALMESRCTVCHNANRIKAAKKSQAQWESVVSRMIQKGAQLSDAEKAALIAYLAQTYAP